MRSTLKTAVFVLVLGLMPFSSFAWNKPGHMVTGAIAYRELKASDPQALSRVINLLKKHPWYEETWKPAIQELSSNDPDKEGLYLFMYAARWPDDVRDDPDLHCELCHYINYRLGPGQPTPPQPVQVEDDILRAFERNVGVVRSNSSDSVRAMALCWIFHLVGDVHQPLHSAALFTTAFPHGDRGGTRFYIRVNNNSSTISLHKLWDGFILGSERFNSVNDRADGLRAKPELQRSALGELSETRFQKWASVESYDKAKSAAYRNGTLQGSNNAHNGAVLPSNYTSTAQPVAERRAAIAGYRLADRLSSWF